MGCIIRWSSLRETLNYHPGGVVRAEVLALIISVDARVVGRKDCMSLALSTGVVGSKMVVGRWMFSLVMFCRRYACASSIS